MTITQAHEQTRILVQTAAQVCEEKKGQDTRILELDPIDSGLADFFLITSALNDRQAQTIADEIELRLKRERGVFPASVEGRRKGDWVLLDYVDFVVHVFLAERRAFYDIERLRKSARPLTPAEFDEELKHALAEKTRAARGKIASQKRGTRSSAAKPTPRAASAKTAAKPAKSKSRAKATQKKSATPSASKKAARKKSVAKSEPA
ncbi:MAG TPA: ribosome silencing factor [Terracidiphilus sp.]|nr:ribosome silencing factor [Terracidiphilus sp.]